MFLKIIEGLENFSADRATERNFLLDKLGNFLIRVIIESINLKLLKNYIASEQ